MNIVVSSVHEKSPLVNTKNVDLTVYDNETVKEFISRLVLDNFTCHYQHYFQVNGFEKEKSFIEKLAHVYGQDFILDFDVWTNQEVLVGDRTSTLRAEVRCSFCWMLILTILDFDSLTRRVLDKFVLNPKAQY